MSHVVKLVDAWTDSDPRTRDSCPGKINGHELTSIAIQYNRRFRFFKRQKHIIYFEKGTRNIWYKNSKCNAGIVAMGFSLKRLKNHPKAVSMETYASIFLGKPDEFNAELLTYNKDWLAKNDYVLI